LNIALVAEVKWEVREVCRRLKLRPIDPADGVWRASLDGHDVGLCMSGMIPSVSKQRVDRFLDSRPFDLMICSGLAGALRDDIAVGDIIVQSEDPRLVEAAETALASAGISFHTGPLVTVAKPVLTPAARRVLAAESRAIAVDMESQTIAALCRERGIPCLAMKGVSDSIDDDLSPILGGFEIVDIPRIARRVLRRPGTWPLAARLARHSYRAANNLGRGVWNTLGRIGHADHLVDATQHAEEAQVA
jgi:adenosylhomocysteine nucleosidase